METIKQHISYAPIRSAAIISLSIGALITPPDMLSQVIAAAPIMPAALILTYYIKNKK